MRVAKLIDPKRTCPSYWYFLVRGVVVAGALCCSISSP